MPEELKMRPLTEFHYSESDDLFEKCERFHAYADQVRSVGLYQAQYRIQLTSPLDHRITVLDPFSGGEREMICFDSNSYLGLHLDPRVKDRVKRTVDTMGFGTASAQVLGGNNSVLRELEELVADRHGREQCLVFPSGYQANVGILTGLLREDDLVLFDAFSHASLQDGCDYAHATAVSYPHRDMEALEALLDQHRVDVSGVLIASDGLFSMHGDLAPLPELREIADRFEARLMIDEAHSLGIIGPTGKGLEEHFGMEGSVDVMMGTFSKSPGAAGGYVCGDAAFIDYLRFFSHGALFTATLPAPICAGLIEAIRIMHDEPEHRERLWQNTRYLWTQLRAQGLQLSAEPSPIVTVRVGDEDRLPLLAMALFKAGIKCGIAQYPAVPRGESILRLTVNARHTRADLDRTIEVLAELGAQFGLIQPAEPELELA